jgi:proprotein convertase subtilisin/kexin type 5
VGIDDAGWETAIEFSLTIRPCYYKCSACWNTDYNTCLQCRKGYYLLGTECNDLCPLGTYADEILNKCFLCSEECKQCSGPNNTIDCSVCNTGFFKLDNGCYKTCPDGYWGDRQDYYCKPCNEACTKCDGPLSSQC